MKASHLRKGEDAESEARRHLESRGLSFVEANYRCPPGELDLIMAEGTTVVFVEVRYRSDQRFGGALESIDARKQRKLRAAAQHYLQRRHGTAEVPCRIDVVLVTGDLGSGSGRHGEGSQIEWIPNAL